MKENRKFDILENANDNEIELLAKVPVLTKKEKARMLKMSKNKLNNINSANNIKEQVSGVEQYKRPKWHSFASIAACIVIISGITGTAVLMNRNTTDPNIDSVPEVSQNTNDIDFDYASTIEELFNHINELTLICAGGGVEVDKNITLQYDRPNSDIEYANYYLVTDKRFGSLEDVNDYFEQYVAQPLITSEYHQYFSGINDAPLFQENSEDGSLYFNTMNDAEYEAQRKYYTLTKTDGVISVDIKPTDKEEMNSLYEKSYTFSVPAKINNEDCTLQGKIVLDNGKWKMSEYSVDFYHEKETIENDTDTEYNENQSQYNEAVVQMIDLNLPENSNYLKYCKEYTYENEYLLPDGRKIIEDKNLYLEDTAGNKTAIIEVPKEEEQKYVSFREMIDDNRFSYVIVYHETLDGSGVYNLETGEDFRIDDCEDHSTYAPNIVIDNYLYFVNGFISTFRGKIAKLNLDTYEFTEFDCSALLDDKDTVYYWGIDFSTDGTKAVFLGRDNYSNQNEKNRVQIAIYSLTDEKVVSTYTFFTEYEYVNYELIYHDDNEIYLYLYQYVDNHYQPHLYIIDVTE